MLRILIAIINRMRSTSPVPAFELLTGVGLAALCMLIPVALIMGVEVNLQISWFIAILGCLAMLRAARDVVPMYPLCLFQLLYPIYLIPNVFWNINLVSDPMAQVADSLSRVLLILSLFSCVVALVLRKRAFTRRIYNFLDFGVPLIRVSRPFFFAYISFLILLVLLVKGSVIYGVENSYEAYYENLNSGNGLPEYLLAFFFVGFYLCRSRMAYFAWFFVAVFFCLKLFLIGLRVQFVMMTIMMVFLSPVRVSGIRAIAGFVVGFLFFSIFGALKESLDIEYILASIFFEMHGDYLVTHHGNVMWASTTMVKLIGDGVISNYIRWEQLLYQLLSSLVPSRIVENFLGISPIGWSLQNWGYSSGGGHLAVFAYLSAGVVGPVLLSVLWAGVANCALMSRRGQLFVIAKVFFIMTMITFPRWMSYDFPNFMLRLPLYTVALYCFISFFCRFNGVGKEDAAVAND